MHETTRAKVRAASLSVASNTILVVVKVTVGMLTGSVSIISEGIHSGLDLVAALIALFAVRKSGRPADKKHRYGHGKIENISGTVEALLIIFAALWIIYEAVAKLRHGGGLAEEQISWGILIMGISAVANTLISKYLMKTAKATDSVALEADALHLRTDVYTSLGVLVGLAAIKLTGITIIDPIAAIAVAALIIKAGFDLTKQAFFPLLDTSLPEEEEKVIIGIIETYSSSYFEFHKLRTRKSGSDRHIDLHLVVPKDYSIQHVHALCDKIETEIEHKYPGAQVLIHTEPCPSDQCNTCVSENKQCPNNGGLN